MVKFCETIATNAELRERYQKHVERIASWYIKNHENYAHRLKVEANLSKDVLNTLLDSDGLDGLLDFGELDYNFGAKLSYFVVADTLIKLILSCWCYAPDSDFWEAHGISYKSSPESWLKIHANSVTMTEILAKVLADEKKNDPSLSWEFDLMALQIEREARNDIAHEAIYAQCLSAIRCYNSIRAMLIFLDENYRQLPEFRYDNDFDFDAFLAAPCEFDFDSYTTVLVAGSAHDIPVHQRAAVANLPWDVIIDLDGYSEFGGLLAAKAHDRADVRVLNETAAKESPALVRGRTTWYRCGDYQDYDFDPHSDSRTLAIPGYTSFVSASTGQPPVDDVLRQLLKRAKELDRPLNIVVLDDRWLFAQSLVELLNSDKDKPSFFITCVGLTDFTKGEICRNWFRLRGQNTDMVDQVFRLFNTPVHLFYEAMADNAGRWQPREARNTDYTLPGRNGPVVIPENLRNNLEPYFDVLYTGCEKVSPETAQREADDFFRGNVASWSVIDQGKAVPLKKEKDILGHLRDIEDTLASTQTNPGKRFFFVQHASGIGGTTFARQLAWRLHEMNYPVLSVKCFDPTRVPPMLENLYDNILDTKPMVLLAEDTLRGLDDLFDYVKRINRRCVLLCAIRENAVTEDVRSIKDRKTIHLTNLESEQISALQDRFRKASPLSYNELQHKQSFFEEELTVSMRTPFIIGLYYMEKEFNISNYVEKVFHGPSSKELSALACMALCDRFGYKNTPASYIQHALDLKPCESFVKRAPAVKSLICSGVSENIDVWHFTHQLLSDEFLDRYCGDNYKTILISLVKEMIQVTAKIPNLNQQLLETLTFLLIKNRAPDEDFSQLMMEIGMPEEQRSILQYLIDCFESRAQDANRRLKDEDYDELSFSRSTDLAMTSMLAHAYAHLGRMFSRRNVHLFEQAMEMGRKARIYVGKNDHRIFHMIGSIILDKLSCHWEETTPSTDPGVLDAYEAEMRDAIKLFNDAIEQGSPEYGYPSKLELYYKYLSYLYKAFDVNSKEEFTKVPEERRMVLGDFLRTLEEAQNLTMYGEFSDGAVRKIERYENLFHSNILYRDYGKAVEYYENQVARFREAHDVDRMEVAMRNLLFTRIKKVRETLDDPRHFPYGVTAKDRQNLFRDVDKLLENVGGRPDNYASYIGTSTLYRYWFQLAKVNDIPVEEGIRMARRWVSMEDNFEIRNPRPYYQLMTVLLLSVLENPLAKDRLQEAEDLQHMIARMDTLKGKKWKIQDMFVGGNGMSRLVDVGHCPNQAEVHNFLKIAVKKMGVARPTPVDALIRSAQTHAVLSIYSPQCWNDLQASLVIGKGSGNNFGPEQINRKVRTLLGFGFDGVEALSCTAKDLDNEQFDLDKLLAMAAAPAAAPVQETAEPVRKNTTPAFRRVAIEPGRKITDIIYGKNKQPETLLCHYNEKTVLLPVSDLMRFGKETLTLYGGIVSVLSKIQSLYSIPCVTVFKQEGERYVLTGSLFDTGIPLHELLGMKAPPVAPVAKPQPEAEEKSDAPTTVSKGTAVNVKLLEAAPNRVHGTFLFGGVEYAASFTGISSNKQLKPFADALKNNQSVPSTVRSGPDKNGSYIVIKR